MQYQYFRLFLTERDQRQIFEHPIDRHQYLIEALGVERIDFEGRGAKYSYVHIGTFDDVVISRIGREKTEIKNDGPETGFEETAKDEWHAVNVFIDTSGSPDGQKMVVGLSPQVGAPKAITQYFIERLNEINPGSKWRIIVNPIIDQHDFWDVAKKYKGRLTRLDLRFVSPNIFGGKDATAKALRKLHDENSVQTTEVRLSNNDGALNPDSNTVRESLEYIEKGGGKVRLRAGNKTIYDSKDSPQRKDIPTEEDLPVRKDEQSTWKGFIKALFK